MEKPQIRNRALLLMCIPVAVMWNAFVKILPSSIPQEDVDKMASSFLDGIKTKIWLSAEQPRS